MTGSFFYGSRVISIRWLNSVLPSKSLRMVSSSTAVMFMLLSLDCLQADDVANQRSQDANPPVVAELSVDYTSGSSDFIRELDLGEVQVGQANAVTLRFTNRSDAPMRFENVHVNCSCMKAQVTKDSIESGETVDFEFVFDGKLNPLSLSERMVIDAYTSDKTRVQFQFRRFYSNLVGFSDTRFIHELRPGIGMVGKQEIRLPLVVSPRQNLSKIEILTAPNLRFISWEIDRSSKPIALVGTFEGSELEAEEASGELILRLDEYDMEQEALLTLRKVPEIQVSPRLALFTEGVSETDGQVWSAGLMLRVNIDGDYSDVQVTSATLVAPEQESISLTSELQQLAKSIFRLKLDSSTDLSRLSSADWGLRLSLKSEAKTHQLTLPFLAR